MPSLKSLASSADAADIVQILQTDGALILEDVLNESSLAKFREELDPYMEATANGADDFSGWSTTRTGALMARSSQAREMVMHPLMLEAANQFLAPYCQRIQLHLTQIIRLKPDQGAQMIHRDRWAWGHYMQGIEPQFNTIWAITDFTGENGATQVVPGSIAWPDDRKPEPHEICQATMKAGSVLVYSGSVFHGGGENRSKGDRIGANLTYTLGWLRQEENQYLSCPPEIAKDFPETVQDLLGYTMGQFAMGYYTPPGAPGEQPECVTPAFAVREVPNKSLGGEDLLQAALDTD